MNRMTVGLVGLLIVAVAAVGVIALRGGSSGGSDEDAVRGVLSDLQSASREGDGQRICSEIFTPKLAALVAASSDTRSCAAEVNGELFSPEAQIEVQTVEVPDESNATATVEEANGNVSTVYLVKQDGQWRIRSVTPA
jgi:hypothetical protein